MLLPTKHLPLDKSALGGSAIVLREFEDGMTVSQAWEAVRASGIATFDQYVAALDLLFLVGVLDHKNGKLVRS